MIFAFDHDAGEIFRAGVTKEQAAFSVQFVFNLFGGGQKAVKPAEEVKAPAPDGIKPPPVAPTVQPPKDPLPAPKDGDKSVLKKSLTNDDLSPPPTPAPKKPAGKRDF